MKGKKIKLIRTFRGLTQKELGDLAGIHEVARILNAW